MVGEGDAREGRVRGDGLVGTSVSPHLEPGFFLPRSAAFHNFVKVSLTKNPKKRPGATKMLSVNLPSSKPAQTLTPESPRATGHPRTPTA